MRSALGRGAISGDTISPPSAWAWVALFFLDDFAYYWFHRISHECRFWWAAHVNHHSSRRYNLSTALRQSWTGVIVGTWTRWIPLAFLGFPPEMILAQQGFNLFYQFWIHTEVVRRVRRSRTSGRIWRGDWHQNLYHRT